MTYEEEWIPFEIHQHIERRKRAKRCKKEIARGGALAGADLSGRNLNLAEISNMSLVETNLSGASLKKANLAHSNLEQANLEFADLRQSNLCYTNLECADLKEAKLSGAYFNKETSLPFSQAKAREKGMVFLRTDYCY